MSLARLRKSIAVAVLAVGAATTAAAQQPQRAAITGRVTDMETGQPIQDVRVFVLGTTLGAATDPEGRYTIRTVPVGTVEVRALRIGYQESKKAVTLTAGETATLDFTLAKAALQLQEVVSTATGEQRRVELGNAVSNINTVEVTQKQAVTNMVDLLQSRAPGVVVSQGTQTGAMGKIRIRGQGSLNLNNDPIYIIDGVRATSIVGAVNTDNTNAGLTGVQGSNIFTGGAQPSRVGDINPEEIESIEIVKGPSAATLYGTDAANGVIVIKTKRGRAGPARWNAYAEYGRIEDLNTYPTNYTVDGHSSTNVNTRQVCRLPTISAGTCVPDSTRTLSVFEDPETTPLKGGDRQQLGLQVSGGSETVRYFVSGEYETENSAIGLPRFERDRLLATNQPIIDQWLNPNKLYKRSFRANLNTNLNPKLDIAVSTGFVDLNQRLFKESNATAGLGSQAFGGPGHKENGSVAQAGNPLRGYRAFTPLNLFQELQQQGVTRFIGAVNLNFRPTSWLATRANVGSDFTAQTDIDFLPNGQGAPLTSTYRLGFRDDTRTSTTNMSVDLGTTASWRPMTWLDSKTTVGAQYINTNSNLAEAFGEQLPPGAQTATAGTFLDADERTSVQKTLGLFVEEAVSFADRLFVTGAVRTDQNSAFGTDFEQVYYPKASISWIASQEPFFPTMGWLSEFRLRAAYGASGTQPGPNDALPSFQTAITNILNVDEGGLQYSAIGNAKLKPERATEFEGGFDARFFNSRANLELTFYNKRTKDALISAIVPPSLGAAIDVRDNLGAVKNQGWELLLTSQILDSPNMGVDLTFTGTTNKNRLLSMGDLPPQVTATSRAQVGYPLFGLWGRKITSVEDKNGDGIITYNANPTLSELTVDDSSTFVGSSAPTRYATLSAGVEFFRRQLRLSALTDYKGGHYLYNNTERIRCASRANCRGLNDRTAPLWVQARTVALRDHPSRTLAGYFEKADFIRFRELSLSYSPSGDIAARLFRARAASVTFAVRNLGKSTDYSGIDPEIDASAADGTEIPSDFQSLGPPTYFTLRLNLGF